MLLHGVGQDPDDRWQDALELALTKIGYPDLSGEKVPAPRYPNGLNGLHIPSLITHGLYIANSSCIVLCVERNEQQPVMTLKELRNEHGLSQQELADAMGASQPGVLKAENAPDPQLSTVRRYIEGIGSAANVAASLEIVAVIDGRRYPITMKGPNNMTITSLTRTASATDATTVWRLRAWDEPALEERFLSEGVIAMSADEIGDMTSWPSDDELRRRLRAGTDNRGEQAIGMFVRYWDDFRNRMKPGDVVVVPLLGRRAAIGLITGDYEYRFTENEPRMRHTRKVRWLRTVDRSALDDGIRKVVNAPGTICRIKALGAADWLMG